MCAAVVHDPGFLPQDQLQAALMSFESEFEALADNKYERLETHGLAPIAERCSELDADMTRFFRVQIPQQIEEESGPVVRQMLKSREAFDIENTKLRSREAQFVARLAVCCVCGSPLGAPLNHEAHRPRRRTRSALPNALWKKPRTV